jgi:hypothetical protein
MNGQSDDHQVAGMHFGPTGANNDATDPNGNADTLTTMVLNAPTSFGGGVPAGQQSPVSGS